MNGGAGRIHSMAASHAREKGREADPVFAVLKEANAAIAEFGLDKVVNATIGAIYDENEKFAVLPSVLELFRRMPEEELMNYAPIAGSADFLEAAIEFAFRGHRPEGVHVKAVATPGGTGAVRHVFQNYLERGQKALIPDWFWGNYRTIAAEHSREIETYRMFDPRFEFTLEDVKRKSDEILSVQDSLVVVFNTPAHNPTGHSMTVRDWTEILDFLRERARDETKRIVVLVDMAYIDYAGDPSESRPFMKLFSGLPENILVALAFSMSKAFTMYGMRSGALIGITGSRDVAEEFFRINTASNRGVWSNGTRGAQRLLVEVVGNPEVMARIDRERTYFRELIRKRADVFLQEAAKEDLTILPYRSGFFITIPAGDPQAATGRLARERLYALHLKKGIRVAVCSVPLAKIPGMAGRIKAALS